MFSKNLLALSSLCFLLITGSACNNDLNKTDGPVKKDTGSGKFKDSDLYDFTQPYLINLPPALDEISGIAYYPKDTSVFAIVDEEAVLFKVPLRNAAGIEEWGFGKANDYEDIVLVDSTFYVLTSDGSVQSLRFHGSKIETAEYEFITGQKKKDNEFESMYVDSGKIITLCKDCAADKKVKTSRFVVDVANNQFHEATPLHNGKVANLIDENKIALKASAAAVHPLNGDLYIVSAVNKAIYIFDSAGNPKEYYDLNPKYYKQPEGIAFTPTGDLIISNEVYLEGNPNLLVLKNKKK